MNIFVIVPNDLRDTIYSKIDEQLKNVPDLIPNREFIYKDILSYYNEYGTIPNFTLTKKEPA